MGVVAANFNTVAILLCNATSCNNNLIENVPPCYVALISLVTIMEKFFIMNYQGFSYVSYMNVKQTEALKILVVMHKPSPASC